jgi:YesN/AraC family two-component response regulator
MKILTCTIALLLATSTALAQFAQVGISQSGARKSVSSRPRSGGGIAKLPQRILAIDDDVTVSEVLTIFLGDAYEVESSATGADGLLKLRREPVELVVLDHRLPDRTGLEILSDLRSIRPNLPVVMLTGYGSEWICAAAFRLGVADYLQKPVNAVDLVGTVQRILSPGLKIAESPDATSPMRSLTVPLSNPIQRAMGLIQQRYWDHFSLSALARQVGMSKYRLSHRFREDLGVTFRDYLLRVRLERAKALLAAGQTSISEVAQNVGFGDLPHFDKVFKRYTGISPSAYRSLTMSRSNE